MRIATPSTSAALATVSAGAPDAPTSAAPGGHERGGQPSGADVLREPPSDQHGHAGNGQEDEDNGAGVNLRAAPSAPGATVPGLRAGAPGPVQPSRAPAAAISRSSWRSGARGRRTIVGAASASLTVRAMAAPTTATTAAAAKP